MAGFNKWGKVTVLEFLGKFILCSKCGGLILGPNSKILKLSSISLGFSETVHGDSL